MSYKVLVADNFHYMDEDDVSTLGEFETAQEAIIAAMKAVDSSLAHLLSELPNATADVLLDRYKSFGDDPYIVSPNSSRVEFSAWKYAEVRCKELGK